jgi:hypothetical protein
LEEYNTESRVFKGIVWAGLLFGAEVDMPTSRGYKGIVERGLYILWTNGDPLTTMHMVFMYATNSVKRGWWERVTVVVWGASMKLIAQNEDVRKAVKEAQEQGVHVSACKACADALGMSEILMDLGVEVKYWGEPLTEILKSGGTLLTV